MKTFDTLKWIRGVRDRQQEQQRKLSAKDKLKKTRAEAKEFRASRPEKKEISSDVSGKHGGQ